MTASSFRRILVMGCSRSGTTLLQSLLASHSRVHTFPETGVFLKAFGMRERVLPWARLGITMGKERKALEALLPSQKDAQGPLPLLPSPRLSLSRSLADVAAFLDGLAEAHGKDVWVEKTPRHILHARRIGRVVPGVICFHVLRRGEDVVASIVDRANRFPDRFPRQADPEYGIRQWNRSVMATEVALEDPGHVVVFFEDLVSAVRETMEALCTIVGLDFEPGMATPADPTSFTGAHEEWKAQAPVPVGPATSKFDDLFDEGVRSQISRTLRKEIYEDLRGRASGFGGGVLYSDSAKA